MNTQTTRHLLLSVLLLTAPFAAFLKADISVGADNTNLVLSGTTLAENIISSGTGNSVEFQASGALDGGIMGTPGVPNSEFDSLKMNGELWRFSGTASLGGTSATTLHVATGTLSLAGYVITGSAEPGSNTVTIDSGATLHFTQTGTLNQTGILNDGHIYISRGATTYFDHNISGSGLLETENVVYLTGTNTHTGGIRISTGDLYVAAPTALGTGTVNIVGGGDLFVSSTTSGDFVFNNPLVGAGRLIVKLLAGGTDVFHFGAGVGTNFTGTFNAQVGTYNFDSNAASALANVSLISIDRDSTVLVASGSHHYKRIQFSTNAAAEVSSHWAATLSFEADFSNPAGPVTSRVSVDENLAVATTANIGVHTTGSVVAPSFSITAPVATNLLAMDEEVASTTVRTGTFLTLAPGKSITDFSRLLSSSIYGENMAAAARQIAYVQNSDAVGNLIYNYYASADANGIYLDYGLVALEVIAGKTLTFSGDTTGGGGNDFKLRITGSGNLDIQATNSILFSSAFGDFTGDTTITSGTLIMSGKLGTGNVTVNPGATLQIGNGSASGYAGDNIVNNGTIRFNAGTYTVSSNISGTSGLRLNTGRIKLSGSNTFSGGLIVTVTSDIENTHALGSGTVTISSGDLWVMPGTRGDQAWNNPWFSAVGSSGGRLIIRMKNDADVFSFQNGSAVGTSGTGTRADAFIMQNGTLLLDGDAVAALRGRQIRVDYGSTVRVAPGTQSFKYINFSANNASGNKRPALSFDADFSNPGNPVLGHLVLDAHAVNVAAGVDVRFDSSSPLGPIAAPPAPEGANPLLMDDDTSNIVFSGTLLSLSSPSGNFSTQDLSRLILDQQIYVNGTASDSLSVGGEFKQNGEAVGNLLYGYSLAADSKGVYLNAGLAGIEVLDGKTLMLSGDTTDVAGANEISLRLTGSGNIDVNATNSIIISNRSNTVSGMTSINSGTLLLTGNLPGDVTINPGTTLQIGENSASGEIGGSLIHNGTLLLRRTSGTFAANISGSGQVVLDHGSNVWLSGSNSHTGGVHFGGPAASFYIGSAHALGSGTLSIAPAAANTRIDVWMRPKEDANYTVDNPFVWTATNSRFIVRMRELTNEFAFGNAAESTFQGIFIAQRGTYQMNGDTAAILANAASIRFDKGSTIILGSSGTTILRDVQFSHTTPAASEAVVGNDPYAKVVLDADFSNPDSPEILSNFIITERLNVGTNTRIQLNHTGAIPVPEFTLPVFGSNILGVDDELNRDGFFTKLISIEPGAVLTGAANWLADMILLDAAGDRINASNNFDFMQDGDKIGTGYVNYFVGQQSDGLYMNYGFASLEIDGGKTLVLSGDTPEDNSFVAMLTGEGNVDVHATDSIKLGTYYGESTLTGTVTLHTGTLGFVTPGALSPASHLELAPDTGMDFNFTNQTVGTLNAPGSTTINLHAGRFTIAGSGTLDSTIFGTGIITVGANATLDVGGNNPDLDANWVAAPNARLTFHSAGAAGIGRVSGSNATSVITVQDVSGGEFNAEVTGGGAFTIASSTIAMTKGVTIGTFNVTASDVTVRHVNGLNASSIAAISDSIIRIDTDSHIRANTLRLNNSSIAFVPQANGSFGNLLVTSLESSGTTLVKMNADLTKAGAGDSIIITDNVVGAYVLDITNVAPGNRGDDGVALRVVRTPDESGLSRFTLKDGYLEAGVFTYELIQGDASNGAFVMNDPNSYYLAVAGASPLTRTAQAVLSTAAIAGAEWHYKLDSLSQRMGDLRREIEAAGKDRFYNTWLRSSSYKLKAGRELSGASFDENVYNFTFGADVGRRLGSGAATLMLGVYGDVGYVDRDFDNRSTGKTNSFGGGLYVTWLHQRGWYADLAFKADTQQNKFTAHALDNSEARGDYTGKTMGVSFEIGRKIKLGRVWWIEPGVQVASATFFKSNYETDNGIQVRIAENDAVQYRAQARIGRENINGRFQPYGRIAYARCRSGSLDVTADGLVLASDLDFDDTRYELGIGASFLFNQRSQLYMEYEYATASHYDRPWAVNIGFRRFW